MSEDGGKNIIGKITARIFIRCLCLMLPLFLATACAAFDTAEGRTPSIPTVQPPDDRYEGLNEKQDPVTRVRLGRDILMPQPLKEDPLPNVNVGPYELRNETLASALQLILDEYDISLAFEGDDGLKTRITISNLHGKLSDVIHKACAAADLYCHFEAGTLTVKKTETFVVDLPPINVVAAAASAGTTATTTAAPAAAGAAPAAGAASTAPASAAPAASSGGTAGGGAATTNDAYTQIATGLSAVLTMEDSTAITTKPVIDTSTRVLIYSATQRSNKAAMQYFERLRKNTALIIFETHIWEVTLNNDSSTGINWTALSAKAGNFNIASVLNDTLPSPTGAAGPITITPSYTGSKNLSAAFILSFISDHGTVKTVSQPQITVLSGSQASLSVSQAENYVSGTTATIGTATTAAQTALTTGTVQSGLTMNITSGWDQSTVYGAINITLNDLTGLNTFNSPDGSSSVQLPVTSTRSIATEIRVRPGDSILIGGMVSQSDSLSSSGPGFTTPLFTTERAATKANTELVFLLRPRVVTFDMGNDSDTPRIVDAPKDGMLPPEPALHKVSESVSNTPVNGAASSPRSVNNNNKAALPAGLSADDFAPQNTPANSSPGPQGQALPVPLSGRPAANSGGGVGQ